MEKRLIFLSIVVFTILTSCEGPTGPGNDCDGNGLPCLPPEGDKMSIKYPSAEQTYWDDKPLPCAVSLSGYEGDEPEWQIDGESASCVEGEFATTPPEGEHEVTVSIGSGDNHLERSETIVVKEGFAVTLDDLQEEAFVGDEVSCSATVTPDKYAGNLTITAGGKDCTDGKAELTEAGETTVTATVQVDDRTEADEATVTVKPVVAGKVYPLTDQGVVGGAGFTVTLTSGGNTAKVQTSAEGNFSIKADFVAEFGAEEVTLEVAETGDFYGARAVLPGEELLALAERRELGFILAPRTWQIRCGPMAGESTSIKLPEAFKRNDPDRDVSSFYKLRKSYGKYKYPNTRPDLRPLPTAFNRAEGSEDITAADSTAFWQETDDVVEEKICRGDLFRPATLAEVPTTADGIHVWAIGAEDGSSAGAHVSSSEDAITGGFISLSINGFGDRSQRHEQGHSLGFGHTSEWVGIMSVGQFSGDVDLTRYSVDDVAHIQVYMDTFDLQFVKDISFGVLQWRRVFDIPSLPDN